MTSRPAPTAATIDGVPGSERAGDDPARALESGATVPAPPVSLELPLVANQMIADKYRLLHPIGHGGMGMVWEAEHQALGRRVAVKFLRPWTHTDPSLPSRFESEARMVASIKHRFVVDVFDFGITDDGFYYMVLELLEGKMLAEHMNGASGLRARDAIHLIADCLRGLHAVHEAGIVHRDLKPENIFVIHDADGMFPKLIDFGISKRDQPSAAGSDVEERRKSRLTQPGTIVGTLDYMSPEQLRGRHEIDRRADVYSIGVILYELLAGKAPYDQDNVGDLMVAIMNTGAPPLSRSRPDLGSELSNVIARALAAAPEARFPTALALRDALLGLLPSIPAEAPTGAVASVTGRGHDTELQLAAAAASFGAGGGIASKRSWWIGLSVLGLVLLGWLLLHSRTGDTSPVAPSGGVVKVEPPAREPESPPPPPAAATPTASGASPPAPPIRAPREPSVAQPKARPTAPRSTTKETRVHKARGTAGANATKKIYRELDF